MLLIKLCKISRLIDTLTISAIRDFRVKKKITKMKVNKNNYECDCESVNNLLFEKLHERKCSSIVSLYAQSNR